MQPTHVVISLPVANLERASTFYKEVFDFALAPGAPDGVTEFAVSGSLSIMLIQRDNFKQFIQGAKVAERDMVECIVSCSFAEKSEVDGILLRAEATGGTIPAPAAESEWGYLGYFKDLDGHLWELAWDGTA